MGSFSNLQHNNRSQYDIWLTFRVVVFRPVNTTPHGKRKLLPSKNMSVNMSF